MGSINFRERQNDNTVQDGGAVQNGSINTTEVIRILFNYRDVESRVITKIPKDRTCESIVVQVSEAFDPMATASIGTAEKEQEFLGEADTDLSIAGKFVSLCNLSFGTETDVYLYLKRQGNVSGKGLITIYLR